MDVSRSTLLFPRLAALSFLLAVATPAQSQQPSKFQVTGCTMECCGYGTWRAITRRAAFARPDSNSATVFLAQPYDTVIADSGIVATEAAGVLRAQRPHQLRVQPYPGSRAWRTITVPAGDTLYVLFESGEATDDIVSYRGSLYGSSGDLDGFIQLAYLRSTWWARVRNADGVVGWIPNPSAGFDGPGECH